MYVLRLEGAEDIYHTGTLSNTITSLAERVAGAAVANGRASADEISKRNEVVPVEVLREAGGTLLFLFREKNGWNSKTIWRLTMKTD